jgi:predicted nucleic acid-binding protein
MIAYVDTTAVICLVEAIEPSFDGLRTHLRRASRLCCSTLTITEALTTAARSSTTNYTAVFEQFFESRQLLLMSADRTICRHAGGLPDRFKLTTADAAHLATAVEAKADLFLTTDRDFARAQELARPTILVIDRPPS